MGGRFTPESVAELARNTHDPRDVTRNELERAWRVIQGETNDPAEIEWHERFRASLDFRQDPRAQRIRSMSREQVKQEIEAARASLEAVRRASSRY
nr:hypothetical protein [Gammaproteobacteria bacterium]